MHIWVPFLEPRGN